MIFVFGSNEAGIHGAGAASVARRDYGAIHGKGVGHHGNSYAIPTKDASLGVLEVKAIEAYVQEFIEYARSRPDLTFQVTQVGCGLAGFEPHEIAPLFGNAPDNCLFDEAWSKYLPESADYWGTF